MRFRLLFFLFIGTGSLQAQLNNTMFEQRNEVVKSDSNTLGLTLRTLAFNKNNEYFSKIADGYTLFGYQINPSLYYQPTSNTRFDIGVYVQKDFGNDDYTEIQPTFTFSHTFGDSKLVIGTLEGSLSHRLIEPLYDFERVMVNRLENGLQFTVNNNWIFLDTWIDWQNMLYVGEDDQEEVTGGLSMNYILMDKDFKISIPLQMVVTHVGGQIDSSPMPLQTYVNSAVGLMLDFHNGREGFVTGARVDGYYTGYKDFSTDQLRPFEDGSGVMLNATIFTKMHLDIMASYWKGNEFLTIQGGKLYPSESSTFKNPFHIEEQRELLILRFMHNLKLADGLVLSGRFEPYFDLLNNRFEFSHALYLNYSTDFKLLKNARK
jgi:hypothetical protein